MHSRLLNLSIFIAISAILSCHHNEVKFDLDGARYFPLQVGNYWKLVPANPQGSSFQIAVKGEVTMHGRSYFKLESVWWLYDQPQDTIVLYYRVDENNIVMGFDSTRSSERELFRLGSPDRYKWNASGTHVLVTIEDQQINGQTITQCKSFTSNYDSGQDDVSTVTFAPNIGYCLIEGTFGMRSRLAMARINGKEYNFN
jgi:hypothetical protein